MEKKLSDNGYLKFPENPIVITYEFSDSEEVEEPVQPIPHVILPPDPFRIPPGEGEEITMEEAKRRFRMLAVAARNRDLQFPRPRDFDSEIESSAELQLASSSSSDSRRPQNVAVQNDDESQPLLPSHDLTSSLTRMGRMRHTVRRFTQSWFYIAVLLLLLVCPGAYLYIGGVFFEQCKILKYFPVLFLLMGVTSSVAVLTRIFRRIAAKLQKLEGSRSWCTYVGLFAIFLFVIVYFVELGFYFTVEDTKHEECNLFLIIAWYSLWITPLVAIVLMSIYCTVRVSGPPIV